MIDIQPLLVPCTAASGHQLAADDPLLDEMISLAERGELTGAASRAQAIWSEGIFDIRTIGFYLCGAFTESGLAALPSILRCIETCLGASWEHLGPSENKRRYGDSALRWLFTTITGQVRFHQRAQKDQWRTLLQHWEQQQQQQLFAALEQCASKLSSVLESDGAKTALYGLVAWLKTLPAAPAAAAPGPAAVAGDTLKPGEAGSSGAKSIPAAAASDSPQTLPELGGAAAATLSVPMSPAMKKLLHRLDAFGRLIALGKFRHAAIVYKDIQASIGSFDPRQYMPSLFGSYYGHVIAHADKITKHMTEDKGFVVETLKELYQIDLELFVSSNG